MRELSKEAKALKGLRISPSQVSQYLDCPTKWYIRKAFGIKEPTSESQRLGLSLHAAAEACIRGDYIPEEYQNVVQRMIEQGLRYLEPLMDPYTTGAVELEHELIGGVVPGVSYLAFADAVQVGEDGVVTIYDHKTGDPRYFKNEHELEHDLQLNWYAYHFLRKLSADKFRLAHIQYSKHAPFTVTQTMTRELDREQVIEKWEGTICVAAKDMLGVHEDYIKEQKLTQGLEDVPRCRPSCSKYGGCKFKPLCWRGASPEELKESIEEGKMSLKTTPLFEGNKPRSPEESAANVSSVLDRLNARKAAVAKAEEPKQEEAPTKTEEKPKKKRGRPKAKKAETQVTAENKKAAKTEAPPVEKLDGKQIKEPGKAIPAEEGTIGPPVIFVSGPTFCVNCIPLRGQPATPLADIIRPFKIEAEKSMNMNDIREDKYNEGLKKFIGAAKADVMEACKKHAYVFVDLRDDIQSDMFYAMDIDAFQVFRGIQ